MRVTRGVLIVAAGGTAGYFIGKRWKHEKAGAAVGVAVGMGVNFAIAASEASTVQPNESETAE